MQSQNGLTHSADFEGDYLLFSSKIETRCNKKLIKLSIETAVSSRRGGQSGTQSQNSANRVCMRSVLTLFLRLQTVHKVGGSEIVDNLLCPSRAKKSPLALTRGDKADGTAGCGIVDDLLCPSGHKNYP